MNLGISSILIHGVERVFGASDTTVVLPTVHRVYTGIQPSQRALRLDHLSRVERGKERPPRPDLVKRMATLLGGDPDLLFRLAESTDPELAEYLHHLPSVPEFLRAAKAMALTDEDFRLLTEEVRRRRPSETVTNGDG